MNSSNFSIRQRMVLALVALILIWGVLLAVVLTRHAESGRAQAAFTDEIGPRRDAAASLERSVLYVGISVRAYLLNPDAGRLATAEQAIARVSETVHAVQELMLTAPGRQLVERIEPLAGIYVAQASRLVHERASGQVPTGEETALSDARERAIAAVREFSALQDDLARAALNGLATTRRRVNEAIIAATTLASLAFIGIAVFTTRSITRQTRELLEVAKSLEEGDWKPALAVSAGQVQPSVRARDEMLQLRRAFGEAALALERREQRLRANREVASAGASSLEKEQVASEALHAIAQYVGAELGVVYWFEPDRDLLTPVASHAVADAAPLSSGEGIPGQAACDRRVVLVRDIPSDGPFSVKLGYDQVPPRAVVAAPIVFGDHLEGVIVLASLRDFDDAAISFLGAMGTQLGVALHNVRMHGALQFLLDEVRAKNDHIVAQNEELQAQNERIQAQSEKIQAQHEEVERQNEELQAQNEQLQMQQEEIQAQNEELSAQAEQLRVHSTLLAEADERKNDFLGVLAHELRNPLAPMTTSLYLLSHVTPGSEPGARAMAVLHRQVNHLTRLIDDLLDVTRISRGKVRLDRERVDLVDVVRTTVEDRQPALDQHGLTLDVHMPSHAVWVEGDRTRLCQVAGNILSNAVKFTPGEQPIRLALEPDYAGGQAVLRVEDHGVGIEPELLPTIFEPFTQGAVGLARTNGGLGLGLALVKSLVELHGGSVEAHSDGPNTGATFIVRLPLADAGRHEEEHQLHSGTSRRWRLLLVEDHVDAATSLREALELQGHVVEVAYSGREALNVAPLVKPEAVLCDIGLPGTDGYEVARQLRGDPRFSETVLIALTGYASTADRARTAQAGFDEHLAKPVSVPRLMEVLSQFEPRTEASASPSGAESTDLA